MNPLAIVTGSGRRHRPGEHPVELEQRDRPDDGAERRRQLRQQRRGRRRIVPGSGVWRVYSTDPAADSRGGLAADFKQYGAVYRRHAGARQRRRLPVPGRAGADADARRHRRPRSTTATRARASPRRASARAARSTATARRSSVGSATFDNRHAGSGKIVSAPVTLVGASNGAMPGVRLHARERHRVGGDRQHHAGAADARRRRRQQGLRRRHRVGGDARRRLGLVAGDGGDAA